MTSRWDRPAPASSGGIGMGWLRWMCMAAIAMGMTWLALGWSQAAGQDGKAAPPPATSEKAAAPVSAPPAPGPTASLDALPSFIELFNTSPVINGIIIGLSVIALLLFIYYLLTINHTTIVPAAFLDDVMKMVLERDFKQAVEFCRHHRTIFISTVIQRCIENVGREHSVLMSIADTEGKRRADILWNRISYLADISNVAPMLGLLGTIVGMMGAFFGLDQSSLDVRSKFISSNIAGAMATTYFGLIVAIAALVFHSIIKGRLTRVLSEAEQAVHAVTDHMKRGEA
jgi:biopolymer transport protein ExbB